MRCSLACPDVPSLRRLLVGPLEEADALSLEQHLLECDTCLRTVKSLKADDTLIDALRGAASVERADDTGIDVAKLIGKLQELRAPETGLTQEWYDFLSPAQSPDEWGRLGPYRVLSVLGAGGMGVVFKAEDPHLERLVAVKAMLPSLAASASAQQRFLREAKAAAAVKHDHIVAIYQVGKDRGVPFLAMELLDGESLEDRLQREGKLPLAEVLRIGREVGEGLAAAHERRLIHRDIKPGNIWLEGKRARVKLLDFGLARAAAEDARLTQAGAIVGTPAYMAPEQARAEAIDGRADLFSLGCVLYRLATGELPFKGKDTLSTLLALAAEHPPTPQQRNAQVSPALSNLIMRLLAKDRADRPASAQELVASLAALEGPSAPLAIPVRSSDEASPALKVVPGAPARRGRRWLAVAAGLLLLVGGGVLLQQVFIRITDKQGNTRDIELKPDEKAEMLVKAPGGDVVKTLVPPLPIRGEPLPPTTGGEPLFPTALVSRPAPLKGVRSWTLETVGHRQPVQVVAYSPDGKWLASMDSEGVRIWEAEGKYNLARVLMAAPAGFTCLAWAPDAVHLATGHAGGEVGLWDARAGRKLRTQKADSDVRSVSWSPDGKRLVAGTDKDQTFVWEPASGTLLHQKKLGAVAACSPDGQTLATCNEAGLVQFWRADTLQHIRDCKIERGTEPTNLPRRVLSWTPNSKRLLLGAGIHNGYASTYRSWILNAETGQVHVKRDPGTHSYPAALSPDGKWWAELVLHGDLLTFHAFDVNTGKLVRKGDQGYRTQPAEALSVPTWSPNGTTVAIGFGRGAVSVWEADAGAVRRVLAGQPLKRIVSLNWSADGKTLHSATCASYPYAPDGFLSWNTSTAEASVTTGPPYPYSVSPDGRSRIVPAPDNTSYALERNDRASGTFKEVHRLDVPRDWAIFAFSWSPDGNLLLVQNGGKKVELHDLNTGKLLQTYPLSATAAAVALAPGGKELAVHVGEELLFMEMTSGNIIDRQNFREVGSLAFSPDGTTLALGKWEGRIELRSADGTKLRRTLTSPNGGGVVALAWSPDGKTLATGGYYTSGGARLWDAETGQPRGLLVALPDDKALAIMPDGHYRGTPSDLARHLVYVIQTDLGQETLTPEEFAARWGWKNDPGRVRLFP